MTQKHVDIKFDKPEWSTKNHWSVTLTILSNVK